MSDILTQPLGDLQALAQTLFHSLSPAQAKPPPVPSVASFLEVDAQLAAAVKRARKHQIKQRRIEQLKDDVLALEQSWRDIIQELQDGKTQLELTLAEGEERLKAIEEAKAGTPPFISCLFLATFAGWYDRPRHLLCPPVLNC